MTHQNAKRLNIVYIGTRTGNSGLRARALERLGHMVHIFEPFQFIQSHGLAARWCFHTGAFGFGSLIDLNVQKIRQFNGIDLVVVNQGEYLGRKAIASLSKMAPVVNYINDDPFGGGGGIRFMRRVGGFRFRRFLKAIPSYNLICVVRQVNVGEAYRSGAKKVLRVFMSADEVVDRPLEISNEERQRFESKVSFVGSWMPERGPFLAELIAAKVPLSIWGGGWEKAPEWPRLKNHWRGPALSDRREYSIALQCAEVNLGLLSKGNRDLHTRRSIEIPAVGGVLCAERTPEHEMLYRDRVEAVFWQNAPECVELCRKLLEQPEWRRRISVAGRNRAIANNLFNEIVMQEMVDCVMEP